MFRKFVPILSPHIKTTGYMQHVFRWGVGNKFRSINANRFTPVHHARPKEVTIREDYFESPNKDAIRYDPVNEQWEVYWYENSKMNAKPFPVKKFGVDQSKCEAIRFHEELVSSGRFATDSSTNELLQSDVPGVSWDDRLQSWVAFVDQKNGKKSLVYSASKHGVVGAKKLAEASVSRHGSLDHYSRLDQAIAAFSSKISR